MLNNIRHGLPPELIPTESWGSVEINISQKEIEEAFGEYDNYTKTIQSTQLIKRNHNTNKTIDWKQVFSQEKLERITEKTNAIFGITGACISKDQSSNQLFCIPKEDNEKILNAYIKKCRKENEKPMLLTQIEKIALLQNSEEKERREARAVNNIYTATFEHIAKKQKFDRLDLDERIASYQELETQILESEKKINQPLNPHKQIKFGDAQPTFPRAEKPAAVVLQEQTNNLQGLFAGWNFPIGSQTDWGQKALSFKELLQPQEEPYNLNPIKDISSSHSSKAFSIKAGGEASKILSQQTQEGYSLYPFPIPPSQSYEFYASLIRNWDSEVENLKKLLLKADYFFELYQKDKDKERMAFCDKMCSMTILNYFRFISQEIDGLTFLQNVHVLHATLKRVCLARSTNVLT